MLLCINYPLQLYSSLPIYLPPVLLWNWASKFHLTQDPILSVILKQDSLIPHLNDVCLNLFLPGLAGETDKLLWHTHPYLNPFSMVQGSEHDDQTVYHSQAGATFSRISQSQELLGTELCVS